MSQQYSTTHDHWPYWESLRATAILGTERRPFTPAAGAGAVGELIARLDDRSGEEALLSAAALLICHRRAGITPSANHTAATTPAPALVEELRECSPASARHLQMLVGGHQRALLSEWLETLIATGRRAPAEILPELLEIGRGQRELRPLIRAAIDIRGRWLATQNPDWEYAVAIPTASPAGDDGPLAVIWDTGARATRLALLEELRRTLPDAARELLASTWSTERADDRAAFLSTFRHRLSMADEPMLEAALDDRSKEVRATAVDLLTRLPDSRLVQRMIERVEPLLRWTPPEPARLLGLRQRRPGQIDVTLPAMCDKSMARDGVDPKPSPNRQGMGERAQWLLQMLRSIPPSYWCRHWGATIEDLIEAAARCEWQKILEAAWIAAAQQSQDAAWAEALLRRDTTITPLLAVLPTERQEALLIDLLATLDGPLSEYPVFQLLRQSERRWSVELTRAALRALRQQIGGRSGQREYLLYGALPEFALRIHPDQLIQATQGWPGMLERWQGAVDSFLITLQLRAEMLAALRDQQS